MAGIIVNLPTAIVGYRVTAIGNSAFSDCDRITSVTIPYGVTHIGESAFYGCTGLSGELILPNSVTTTNRNAFWECSGLTELVIPESVLSIGDGAFFNCTSLQEMTFEGAAVPGIGVNVFDGMTVLKTVYVPAEAYDAYVETLSGLLPEGTRIKRMEGTWPIEINSVIPTWTGESVTLDGSLTIDPTVDLMNLRMMVAGYDRSGRMIELTDEVVLRLDGSFSVKLPVEAAEKVTLFFFDSRTGVPYCAAHTSER